jgi:cytochrome c
MRTGFYLAVLVVGALNSLPAAHASAGAQLALDKGCFSCHGAPPRKNAPSFEALARDYARYQGEPAMETRLADELREGHVFGGIPAHERLSAENARALVRWIIEGAR